MRIKKGDIVAVTTGKSKPIHGKYNTGEVLKVVGDRVIVKGINIVTKHNRPSQANPDGGITHKEAPIHISNIAYLDPVTKKPTRVEYQFVDGKKVRVTKDSGTIIDK